MSIVRTQQIVRLQDGASRGNELTAETGGNSKWSDYITITVGCKDGCCSAHTISISAKDFERLKRLKPSRFK